MDFVVFARLAPHRIEDVFDGFRYGKLVECAGDLEAV
jgi:hypothetical protein